MELIVVFLLAGILICLLYLGRRQRRNLRDRRRRVIERLRGRLEDEPAGSEGGEDKGLRE
ncbi:MAG: hypothetical protein FJY67_07100 [Calditrichaeota bacterium]|nr:hypothetical protein [Calditrichota bacterium]